MDREHLMEEYRKARKVFEELSREAADRLEQMSALGCGRTEDRGSFIDQLIQASDRVSELMHMVNRCAGCQPA